MSTTPRDDRYGPPEERPPGPPPPRRDRNIRLLWIAVGILVVAVLVLVGLIIFGSGEELAEDRAGVTVDDIVENPDHYYGEVVSLAARVVDVYSDQSLTVASAAFQGDAELLVVTEQPINTQSEAEGLPVLPPGTILDLTGEVRQFDLAAVQEQTGAELASGLSRYEGGPVLIAQKVASSLITPGGQPAGTTTSQAATTTTTTTEAPTTTVAPTTTSTGEVSTTTTSGQVMMEPTLEEFLANPDQYYGNEVRLTGRVTQILDPLAFGLAPQGAAAQPPVDQQALVVTVPTATDGLDAGTVVRVTGLAQAFDQNFRNSAGALLADAQLNDWDGRPAILVTHARNVEPQ